MAAGQVRRFSALVAVATLLLFVAGGAAGGAEPGWFYRMVVKLSHGDEPLDIEVIIACGSQTRHILGEGRSARAIWAPYIYGIRTKSGAGVLVQSPNVCDRDIDKEPLPADFLPVVFWAPDASNLEFMVAYVHERAYAQPVSKLTFHGAVVTSATRADHEVWRKTKWKANIVPLGNAEDDRLKGISFFRGDGFFPNGDPRNARLLRTTCHSYIRVPLPAAARDLVRARWSADRPRYWLLGWDVVNPIIDQFRLEIHNEARRKGLWEREPLGALATFYTGKGVNRPSGVGHIETNSNPLVVVSGQAARIPYRAETGHPWADARRFAQGAFDIRVDTADGADQGFAYCYRDMFQHFFPRPVGGERKVLDHRIFVDGQLVGTWHSSSAAPGAVVIERDEYLWRYSNFPLTHELARMQ